jgi:hypothetical protein
MDMLLSRRVLIQAPDGSTTPDESWRPRTIALYSSLYAYLRDRNLLSANHVQPLAIERLLLRESDLAPPALALWRSGAVYRWLGSFDRSPEKRLDNYQILDKALHQGGGSA